MAKQFTLTGEVGWEINAYVVRNMLSQANGEDVEIMFSSPGGSVFEGIEVFNLFRMYEGNVSFHIIGEASSMGSYIVLSGGQLPTAEPNATFFIHNARSYVGGDQNAMRKRADILEGLSNIIMREYVAQTDKDEDEIKQMMDAETFFFGSEILDAGFVSGISQNPEIDISTAAKQSAIAMASERFEACMKKLESEKPEDYEQAAARLAEFTGSNENHKPRVKAEEPTEEKISMTLEQFLAENPAEKARHDAMLVDAKSAGKSEVMGIIARVVPILGTTAYKNCMPTAVKVLKGEADPTALDAVVAVVDFEIEAKKNGEVVAGQQVDTPPQIPVAISEGGAIETEDDYQAMVARSRAELGLKD